MEAEGGLQLQLHRVKRHSERQSLVSLRHGGWVAKHHDGVQRLPSCLATHTPRARSVDRSPKQAHARSDRQVYRLAEVGLSESRPALCTSDSRPRKRECQAEMALQPRPPRSAHDVRPRPEQLTAPALRRLPLLPLLISHSFLLPLAYCSSVNTITKHEYCLHHTLSLPAAHSQSLSTPRATRTALPPAPEYPRPATATDGSTERVRPV